MDIEEAVIEENVRASKAELPSGHPLFLASNTGLSRLSTDKRLCAEADETIYCFQRYGRCTPPLRRK